MDPGFRPLDGNPAGRFDPAKSTGLRPLNTLSAGAVKDFRHNQIMKL
jgi:hypothetical protein